MVGELNEIPIASWPSVPVRDGPAFRDRTLVCETGSAKMAVGGPRRQTARIELVGPGSVMLQLVNCDEGDIVCISGCQ